MIVHTSDDQSMWGILRSDDPDGIVLGQVQYLDAPERPFLAGEVFIPRRQLSFLQCGMPPLESPSDPAVSVRADGSDVADETDASSDVVGLASC